MSVKIVPNAIAAGMGVSLHALRDVPGELGQIAAAGITLVRIDVTWSVVEQRRGSYDWSGTDPLVRAIAAHGMRPLLILAYSNPAYEPILSTPPLGPPLVRAPADDSSRAAYARFATRAASRYRRYRPLLELWNEPNADRFWPPRASPPDYVALAGRACAAIRRDVPDAEVIAPGFGNNPDTPAVDSPLMAALGRSPLVDCLSAVSVHPYLFMGVVDHAPDWWVTLRATLGPASRKPLVASEWGLSTYSRRLDEFDQASYLVRMAIYDEVAGVRATIWYDWRDDGADPNDPEHHFGLVWADGRPKPAYDAMRMMTHTLGPFPKLCFLRRGAEVRAVFFGNGTARRMVAWDVVPGGRTLAAEQRPLTVVLPAGAALGSVSDVLGRPARISASSRQVTITGGQPPFYLAYSGSSPSECAKGSPDA